MNALRPRLDALLAHDLDASGFTAPRTTRNERAALAAPLLGSPRRDAGGLAAAVGLRPLVADLPEATPVAMLPGGELYYRATPDLGPALIFAGVAARLLERAGVDATEADTWLLAADLAGPGLLFGIEAAA